MKGMISMILNRGACPDIIRLPCPDGYRRDRADAGNHRPNGGGNPAENFARGIERPEPEDADFVRVRDYLPDVLQELPYAGTENFTGHRIYEFTEVFLRFGTVKKLQAVCAELAGQGLTLKIWDGFRPVSAQFRLWEVCPDDTYVANPNRGFSAHSRGNTVDVTLVDSLGNELEMPTDLTIFPERPTGLFRRGGNPQGARPAVAEHHGKARICGVFRRMVALSGRSILPGGGRFRAGDRRAILRPV